MSETFVAVEDPDGWLRTDDRWTPGTDGRRYDVYHETGAGSHPLGTALTMADVAKVLRDVVREREAWRDRLRRMHSAYPARWKRRTR